MLELRSEKTIESTMRRVGKSIASIFRNEALEIFIPVFKRDLDVFEMKTGCYIFVRSTSFQSLLRMKTITGVVSLVTEGDSNRATKAIKVDDAYVQGIIKDAEEEFRNRALGIEIGSFVRVLNGELRDYCGIVEVVGDGKAVVRITQKTKCILLETPVRNLLNLPNVPKELQVFYYCDLVRDLYSDFGEEGAKLIAEDRNLGNDAPVIEQYETTGIKHSRQRTVTALVKKLVLVENMNDPLEISKRVIAALKAGEIRAPKNLFIVFCVIKDTLMRCYFKKIDPTLSNYRDVIRKYGKRYKFSAQHLAEIDPQLGIPLSSEVGVPGTKRRGRPPKIKSEIPGTKTKAPLSPKNKAKVLDGLKRYHARKLKAKTKEKKDDRPAKQHNAHAAE